MTEMSGLKTLFWSAIFSLSVLCAAHESKQHYKSIQKDLLRALPCAKDELWLSRRNTPLYVLPHIQSTPEKRGLLKEKLEAMEPGGAKGNIQLGFSTGVHPLRLFSQKNGKWIFDPRLLKDTLKFAVSLNRPFVVVVINDHFVMRGIPLLDHMLANPDNLMHFRDGSVPKEGYFQTELVPITLSLDERLEINRYSFAAMEGIAKELAVFDRDHPGLLVGVAMNGETHFLFRDFFEGTGNFDNPEFTDYGDSSIREFATYLLEHGIPGDAARIRDIPLDHYNSGYLPVSGWVDMPSSAPDIDIYVDGMRAGAAEYPINRLDVYEAGVVEPNTGFTYRLDTSDLASGIHTLQVVISHDGRHEELARRLFIVNEKDTSEQHWFKADLRSASTLGYLDHPREEALVRYDPLVRHWMNFRGMQINKRIEAMGAIFRTYFPPERIFSYQIAPWLFGNWNVELFGVSRNFFKIPGVTPGINLYGGNVMNRRALYGINLSQGYAVPEMHPQMKNAKPQIEAALRGHYCLGAKYIAPYFIKLSDEIDPSHDRFSLTPENPEWGSNDFYHVIEKMVRQ